MFKDLFWRFLGWLRARLAGTGRPERTRRALLVLYEQQGQTGLRVYLLPRDSQEDDLKEKLLEELRGSKAA